LVRIIFPSQAGVNTIRGFPDRRAFGPFRKSSFHFFAAKTLALRIILEDPGDDKFVACAVALKADVILSGDKHLRDMGDYMGIKVLGPAQFLTFFQQAR